MKYQTIKILKRSEGKERVNVFPVWRNCQAVHQGLLEEGGLGLCVDVGSGPQEHLQDFQGDWG